MPEFLKLIPPDEALNRLMTALPPVITQDEMILTDHALERVLTKTIDASENSPSFNRSTVDGFAVIASDTYGACETNPAFLKISGSVTMGKTTTISLEMMHTAQIFTGGMLPGEADAVVMIENTQVSRDGEISVFKPVAPGDNIVREGEDIQDGQVLFEKGVLLRPEEIGSLMSMGITKVLVQKKPRIAIISSGDEVISPSEIPNFGQVRDINSYSLAALITQLNCEPKNYGIIPDDATALDLVLEQAISECDVVVVTAGSSASVRDLTADAIQKLGKPGVLVHGIHIKPGKPTIFGVCRGKPVIGLPGNPVSALVIARIFLPPVIERISGILNSALQKYTTAVISINLPSESGRVDYFPVRLRKVENDMIAEPIFYKSSLIYSLTAADGLALIPSEVNGVYAGERVQILLF